MNDLFEFIFKTQKQIISNWRQMQISYWHTFAVGDPPSAELCSTSTKYFKKHLCLLWLRFTLQSCLQDVYTELQTLGFPAGIFYFVNPQRYLQTGSTHESKCVYDDHSLVQTNTSILKWMARDVSIRVLIHTEVPMLPSYHLCSHLLKSFRR